MKLNQVVDEIALKSEGESYDFLVIGFDFKTSLNALKIYFSREIRFRLLKVS